MPNGYVGEESQIPQGYRCYMLFLANETALPGKAEEYIMRHFWEVASSVGEDVLFTGIVRGNNLAKARRRFGIVDATEAVILLFDVAPVDWSPTEDPMALIPLTSLKTEYDVLELLHLLVTVSKERNFIGKVKRQQTFAKVKEYLSYLPTVGGLVKYVLPGS